MERVEGKKKMETMSKMRGIKSNKKKGERVGGGKHTLTLLQACCPGISALIHELSFPNCPRLLAFSSFGCHLDSKESFG